MTQLSVVVVNLDKRDLLRLCLASLREALARVDHGSELVVVDNASSDGAPAMVRAEFSEAVLIELGRNSGFAGGMAAALEAVRGEWVACVNNDATVSPEALERMLEVAESAADVGSVAAQMRFADRPEVINSAGVEVDRLGVASDRLLGEPASSSERAPIEVFGTSGGAALYRRAMLDEVGGFDPSFFAFLEDVDVAWKARMHGWRCLYVPSALVHHHHSATARHASPFKLWWSGRNRVRVLARNATTTQLRRYGLAMVAYDLVFIVYAALSDRTLAPLHGRLAGLRSWRADRAAGARHRRPVTLGPVRGLRWALRRRRHGPRSGGAGVSRAEAEPSF